ncbi:MAG: NTP transferase domain-containing protein, partial [Candidatus Eremiobacteraeota bacterium]|nr:NTP transferase domain-containing protein [Candidatus Eremiobacteraeota bacterium]
MALEAPLTAVVLAGGPRDELSDRVPGAPNKAFVPIAGVTLVERTIAALRRTPRVANIVAVAPLEAHAFAALRGAGDIRPGGATMAESLRSGLRGLPPDDLVLVCASDLPVLTRAALEEFIALAQRREADIVYACVERRTHAARFPDVPHT